MTNEISVVDLAKELRRLANCLVRELGKDPGVAPLSYIAAIKPLVNYISEEYSCAIAVVPAGAAPEKKIQFGFCPPAEPAAPEVGN
jgi:hypothetical protein